MDTSRDAPNFQCAPKEFTNRDTITLRAEVPHGGQLAVTAPDSTYFYLIFPQGLDRKSESLMPPETFANLLITRFRADIRGRANYVGRDTLQPIFNKPGRYTFLLSSNLGTEIDDEADEALALWKCTVTLLADR